ncbi:hypothetical protein EBR04_10270, partial [bacterium]|nr:hypothetical protein [bacterium]
GLATNIHRPAAAAAVRPQPPPSSPDLVPLVPIARVVPEREMWLHENRSASAAVQRGLADAKAGRLNSGPDLAADAALADRLQD